MDINDIVNKHLNETRLPTEDKPETVKVGRKEIGLVWYDPKKKWWHGYHYKTDHGFYGADTKEMAIEGVKEQDSFGKY